MYCKYLSKKMNGQLKCKLNKQQITLDKCKSCSNLIVERNKPIKKVSKKRKFVSKETYQKVYERDNGRCRLCGNNQIQLHHIVYRSEDVNLIDEPNNCIMLCLKCHEKVHKNKDYWQNTLKEIVGGIENGK